MTNDLVSDMLTRIRNASLARHSIVRVCYSKLNLSILKVLQNENYISEFHIEDDTKTTKSIKIIRCTYHDLRLIIKILNSSAQ